MAGDGAHRSSPIDEDNTGGFGARQAWLYCSALLGLRPPGVLGSSHAAIATRVANVERWVRENPKPP